MKKIKTLAIIFFDIWFISSLINACLFSLSMLIFPGEEKMFLAIFTIFIPFSFFCSYLFSIPFIVVGLIIAYIFVGFGIKPMQLYKLLLITGFLCSLIGAVLFINMIKEDSGIAHVKYFMAMSMVIAATFSIIFLHKKIKGMQEPITSIHPFLGIWLLSVFINSLLCSIIDWIFNEHYYSTTNMIIIGTYILSIPFTILFLMVLWLSASFDCMGNKLYKLSLRTGFIFSSLGSIFFVVQFGSEFKQAKFLMAITIIASALLPIFFFRKKIITMKCKVYE